MRRALVAVLAGLVLAGCAGPRPEVRSAEVAPPVKGLSVVTVVVANRSGGEGQVELKVTLRDGTGSVVAREERSLELQGNETVTLVMELRVPDGAQGLRVHAEAVYPPD